MVDINMKKATAKVAFCSKLLFNLDIFGSPTWARTRDLRINSPALYRLSYRGIAFDYRGKFSDFSRV